MNTKIDIYCKNIGRNLSVEGGASLADILADVRPELDFDPICALVNNKTEHLGFNIFAPKEVEFLDRRSAPGNHVYVRSLCMMAYCALRRIDNRLRIRFEHSVSRGHFCRVFFPDGNLVAVDSDFANRLEREMSLLANEDIPFVRHERRTPEVIDIFRKQGLLDKVELLSTISDIYSTYYTLGPTADSYYGPLAASSAQIDTFSISAQHNGLLILGPDPLSPDRPAAPVTQEKMFRAFTEHLDFNRIIGVASVGELNRAVEAKRTSSLINVAEALHDKLLGRISDEILRRKENGGASIILMAGPSSSGKTTSSKRLAIQLMTNLITPKLISLDDYFVDRHLTPRDSSGDYDFESLYALDLDRFNSDLEDLLAGKEINLPTYSFELGCRVDKKRPLRLDAHDVLIVEGIHGLNPALTPHIDPKALFKVYVSALTTLRLDDHNWISTSDTRLLRRIVRDNKYRHTSPVETIRRWPSVRAGEEKWIFPFQENADATFNSSLLFEIGVMKRYAEPLLEGVPHNVPEYTQAYRLLRFLHSFRPITDEQVPSTSLLREFLGGSSFHY